MSKINVDIEELRSKLDEMTEDDYVTAQLEITDEKFGSELQVSAVSFEYDNPIPYGSIYETEGEI